MLWLILLCLVAVTTWLELEKRSVSSDYAEKVKKIQANANTWLNDALEPYQERNLTPNSKWYTNYTSSNDPRRESQLVPIRTALVNLLKTINATLPYTEVQNICRYKIENDDSINTTQSPFAECILNKIWDDKLTGNMFIMVRELREYVTPPVMLCIITSDLYMQRPNKDLQYNHPKFLFQIDKNNNLRLKTKDELVNTSRDFKDWFEAVTPSSYRSVLERFGKPKLTDAQYIDAVRRARTGEVITIDELRWFLMIVYLATFKK